MSQEPRIGVYVCHCGLNIAGTVDVNAVVETAKNLPNVIVSKEYVFMCSAPGQDLIKEDVEKNKLNRVIVAACSPTMHEPTFRAAIEEAGINPYLFEMANIREHCSWVHSEEKEKATEKAKDLIRMAVAKVRLLEALDKIRAEVNPEALVLGGGIAGLRAALDLGERDFKVHLVEKKPTVGGMAARIGSLAHTDIRGSMVVKRLVEDVAKTPNISIYTNSELTGLDGSVGTFKATIQQRARFVDSRCNLCGECASVCPVEVPDEYEFGLTKRKAIYLPFKDAYPPIYVIDPETCTKCGKCVEVCGPGAIDLDAKDSEIELEASGTTVAATGYDPYEPPEEEYGYEVSDNVITLFQLDRLLAEDGPTKGKLLINGSRPESVAFILCVGSLSTTPNAHPYCSRMCCSSAMKDALKLKELYPDIDIYFIHKDIRTYGRRDEDLYWKSIENLIRFVRFDEAPTVRVENGALKIEVNEVTVQEQLLIPVDAVVLGVGMAPSADTEQIRNLLKVGCGAEGFLKEAHLKLRPVEALTDGIFLAGAATGPKNIIESITAGSATAAKAATILTKDQIEVEPLVAEVDEEICSGCGVCIALCPYEAITQKVGPDDKRLAEVNSTLCKNCGTCVAACPSRAMDQAGYKDVQVMAQVVAAFQEE